MDRSPDVSRSRAVAALLLGMASFGTTAGLSHQGRPAPPRRSRAAWWRLQLGALLAYAAVGGGAYAGWRVRPDLVGLLGGLVSGLLVVLLAALAGPALTVLSGREWPGR